MAGAVEVRAFEVTCFAGTPQDNPAVLDMSMPPRTVHNIRVRVPPGPNGNMGFAIGAVGTNIIPINDGEFIIASDEIFEWALPGQINSGAWQAIMYNEGIFDHTIYVTFTVELPDVPGQVVAAQPIVIPAPSAAPTPTALPSAPMLQPAAIGGSS